MYFPPRNGARIWPYVDVIEIPKKPKNHFFVCLHIFFIKKKKKNYKRKSQQRKKWFFWFLGIYLSSTPIFDNYDVVWRSQVLYYFSRPI